MCHKNVIFLISFCTIIKTVLREMMDMDNKKEYEKFKDIIAKEASLEYKSDPLSLDINLRSKIKDDMIYKLSKLEMNILNLDKYNIKNKAEEIKNTLEEIKTYYESFKDYINIAGYESTFIKMHIEKYELYFKEKLKNR